jgi:hypothetical protein
MGECSDRKLAANIVCDPGVEALEAGIPLLQGKRRAELRLATGTFEEDDELAGNR